MRRLLTSLLLILPLIAAAQRPLSPEEYAAKYSDIAVEKMEEYGIPASITLAQGMLESGYGGSELALNGNNHFGIKCGSSWKGDRIYHDDDSKGECFRKYPSVEHSYRDHSDFLRSNRRYEGLFKLKSNDYKGWAHGLKAAGYATNPKYANLLIDLIERHGLDRYDSGRAPIKEEEVATVEQEATKTPEVKLRERESGTTNRVKYVVALEGDSWEQIAKDNKMTLRRLLRLNDLPVAIELKAGDHIYIKTKKGSNKSEELYTAQSGDSRHSLSQRYAIKLSALMRLNPELRKREVRVGDLIRLK